MLLGPPSWARVLLTSKHYLLESTLDIVFVSLLFVNFSLIPSSHFIHSPSASCHSAKHNHFPSLSSVSITHPKQAIFCLWISRLGAGSCGSSCRPSHSRTKWQILEIKLLSCLSIAPPSFLESPSLLQCRHCLQQTFSAFALPCPPIGLDPGSLTQNCYHCMFFSLENISAAFFLMKLVPGLTVFL